MTLEKLLEIMPEAKYIHHSYCPCDECVAVSEINKYRVKAVHALADKVCLKPSREQILKVLGGVYTKFPHTVKEVDSLLMIDVADAIMAELEGR
jgi:hypothetical protein